MPDTFTANYNLTKPEVNASRDTWGTKHNANLDELDTIIKNISTNRLPYDPTTKAVASEVNFTGVRPKAVGVELATKNDMYGHLPAGSVIMWWGPVNAIPAGWALCNGQNGTPNMLDRVPVCAGSGYAVGSTGGAAQIQLQPGHLPPHYHGIYIGTTGAGGHAHGGSTTSNGNHNHTYTRYGSSNANVAGGGNYFGVLYGTNSVNTNTEGAHTHSISTDWVGDHAHIVSGNTDNGPQLGNWAFDIRQPWVGIVFIMKLAAA